MRPRVPALFVGHGSPMNALEKNEFHRAWRALGERIGKPRAVLCVSAHWETDGLRVSSSARPRTIHDFGGFPDELFAIQYAAPGDPSLAARVAELTHAALDPSRGLDHGAWSVLRAMYPEADVPVVQLSLDVRRGASGHFDLGRALAPLRDEGVLVVGSGDVVHNLRAIEWGNAGGAEWAVRFDALVKEKIRARDDDALVDFDSLAPEARLAVPTDEHYLPLLYVLALRGPGEPVEFATERVVMGSISMTSVIVGASSETARAG